MEALKKKWNSRQGASILLALLFLLVCMMAAASIVIAAASDAGKIDSNKKEQQKYLTLSSALTLVCNNLERVEYVGIYDYEKTTIGVSFDEDGNEVEDEYPDDSNLPEDIDHYYHKHTYTRRDGLLQPRSGLAATPSPWGLNDAVSLEKGILEPLRERLDYVFANHFIVPENQKLISDKYDTEENGKEQWSLDGFPPASFTLELKADDSLDREIYGTFVDTVQVVVELRTDGSIKLTATLMKAADPKDLETDYAMTAVLRPDPDKWMEQQLVLSASPEYASNQTDPVRWKLDVIVKEENE